MNTDCQSKFRALHAEPGSFVIPNPWDVGSTRIMEKLGFRAVATTSGGMAYGLGKCDGAVSRTQTLAHCRSIVNSTSLPVSADLENGFGDHPEDVAQTIVDVAETAVAGCSIEDYTGNPGSAIFDKALAVERVQAASEACSSLGHDFVLTARCENLVWEEKELSEVIDRLLAYESAGADVLFAPGLNDLGDIKSVVSELTKPVTVIMSDPSAQFGVGELTDLGVKRISIGSSFSQLAYGHVISAAREIIEKGSFNFTADVIDYQELEAFFAES